MNNASHDHQKCIDLFARMSEYLDNELDESMCRSIRQHLANCPACKTCLATLRRTVDLYRTSAGGVEVPSEMSARLKALCDDLQKK